MDQSSEDQNEGQNALDTTENELAHNETKKPSVVQIGGSAPSQDSLDELDNVDSQPGFPRQTTVIGLPDSSNGQDAEGQVQVIGPQYAQEDKEKPQTFVSASQVRIDSESKSNLKVLLPIILFTIVVLGAFSYYMLVAQAN